MKGVNAISFDKLFRSTILKPCLRGVSPLQNGFMNLKPDRW
jgi:hypothetical protein